VVDETSKDNADVKLTDDFDSNLELPPLPEDFTPKKQKSKGILGIGLFGKKAAPAEEKVAATGRAVSEAPEAQLPPLAPAETSELSDILKQETAKKEGKAICSICGKEFNDRRALKIHMKQVHPKGIKYCLTLKTGDRIKSLDDLRHFIKYIDDDTYAYHTNQKNDFADWVENALLKKELADKLRLAKTKVDAIRVLYGKEIRPSGEEEKKEEIQREEIEPVEDYSRFMPQEEKIAAEHTTEKKEKRGIFGIFGRKKAKLEPEKISVQENLIEEEKTLEKELEADMNVTGEEAKEPSEETGTKLQSAIELKKELDQKDREIRQKVEELMKDEETLKIKEKEIRKGADDIIREEKKLENKRKNIDDKIKKLEKTIERIKAEQKKLMDYKKELKEKEKKLEQQKREIEKLRLKKEELIEIRKNFPKMSKEYSKMVREMKIAEKKTQKLREEYEKKMPGFTEREKELREREGNVKKQEQELEEKKHELMDMQYRLLEEKNRLEEERFELYVKHELKKEEIPQMEQKGIYDTELFSRIGAEKELERPEFGIETGAYEQKFPEAEKGTERGINIISFESAEQQIRTLAEQGRFEEANALLQRLEEFSMTARISESEKRKQHYKILELRTDLKLAAIRQNITK